MNNCPYCGKSGDLYFAVCSRRFHRCIACGLIYKEISRFYGDAVASYRTNYFDRFSIDQVEGQRFRLYHHILELVAENREPGKLLDVGTGCGFFLVAAQRRNWKVKGVEPSIQSVEVARKYNSLDVFHGTLEEYGENGRFDVITFINVLDHSTLPWLEINRARELLLPGGLIYLRFPNGLLHSKTYHLIHKLGLSNSLDRFLVIHEYSFTPRYIRRLLHDHGFIQTSIRNSPPSEGDPHGLFPDPNIATYVKKFIYSMAKYAENISFGRLLLGTSLAVTAVKSDHR